MPVAGRVHDRLSGSLAPRNREDPLGGTTIAPALAATLSRRRGGAPLPSEVAEPIGQLLGADLSTVRVHTDAESDQISRLLHADAFTYGSDVYFARGRFEPSSQSGQHLLAHELAHVAQAAPGTGGPATVGRIDDPAEAAADHAADHVITALRRQAATISRQPVTPQSGSRPNEGLTAAPPSDRLLRLRRVSSPQHGGDERLVPAPLRAAYPAWSTLRRKVGFEIQTNFPMQKSSGENYGYRDRTFSDKLTDPAEDADPYFHIEADLRGSAWEKARGLPGDPNDPTSIMEFVTGAFDTSPAGGQAHTQALERIDLFMRTAKGLLATGGTVKLSEVADAYAQKLGSANTSQVNVLEDDAVVGEENTSFKPVQHAALDELASAQPQTTFAVPLAELPKGLKAILAAMVTTLDSAKASFTPEQIASEKEQAQARLNNVAEAEGLVARNLDYFRKTGDRTVRLDGLPKTSRDALTGLLVLIEVFITEPRKLTSKAPPYAKAYYTFMHRVDFNSLFRSLPADVQPLAGEFLTEYAAHFEKNDEVKQLLPLGLAAAPTAGPTTADWLQSIHKPGEESELSEGDQSRIRKQAFKAVQEMSSAEKTEAALALFRTTPLGAALAAASAPGLAVILSKFAAQNEAFFTNPALANTLDLKAYPKIAGAFEVAWKSGGELPYERLTLAGVCAKYLQTAPLTDDEYRALTDYAHRSVKTKPDDQLMDALEARFTKEYLQRDLLSRGKITEGEESASMGRWGLEKAKKEGAILELRAMPTGVTPADWERFTKAAYDAIKNSGG
jgi:hypothetical protein